MFKATGLLSIDCNNNYYYYIWYTYYKMFNTFINRSYNKFSYKIKIYENNIQARKIEVDLLEVLIGNGIINEF